MGHHQAIMGPVGHCKATQSYGGGEGIHGALHCYRAPQGFGESYGAPLGYYGTYGAL